MKIAIKGHASRGKEIIQIFKDLGTKGLADHTGSHPDWVYLIDDSLCPNQLIVVTNITFLKEHGYKVYTLKEFEKEFPFKIGDKVKHITSIGIIKEYCYINNEPAYKVESMELGIIATIPAKILEPYKEMKEERNITLTLEKAKEWYKKGGELREIALQAFTEKELTKIDLPKTWEEFCENYPVQSGECWLGSCDEIYKKTYDKERIYKNWIPSRKSAEAHLAMIQLEQLRDCWRQGWIPSKRDGGFGIRFDFYGGFRIIRLYSFSAFLSFPTEEMAEEFLECFRDLIEKAGDLI